MRQHPEAVVEAVLARAEERSGAILESVLRPSFTLYLYTDEGARHVRTSRTYAEAVALRKTELRSGRYEKAWLHFGSEEDLARRERESFYRRERDADADEDDSHL